MKAFTKENYEKLNAEVISLRKQVKKLQVQIAELEATSITWSVKDFTTYELNGWQITVKQAKEALYHMIREHDCNLGITWHTIVYYITEYGTAVPIGHELWRRNKRQAEKSLWNRQHSPKSK